MYLYTGRSRGLPTPARLSIDGVVVGPPSGMLSSPEEPIAEPG